MITKHLTHITNVIFTSVSIILVMLCATSSHAQISNIWTDAEQTKKASDQAFIEPELKPPTLPLNKQHLLAIPVTQTNLSFFVDSKSIQLFPDQKLVRLTLVIENATGSQEIQYHGLRCDVKQHRRYASANTSTNTWRENTIVEWLDAPPTYRNNQIFPVLLYNKLFCTQKFAEYSLDDILRNIRAYQLGKPDKF